MGVRSRLHDMPLREPDKNITHMGQTADASV